VMDELFKPEVVQQFLEILKSATDGGVTVLVVYFLLPLLMLLVSSIAWFSGVYVVSKGVFGAIKHYLSREYVKVTKFNITDKFITCNSTPDEFVKVIDELKAEDHYIHTSHCKWLSVAIENQRKLDKKYRANHHRPHVID